MQFIFPQITQNLPERRLLSLPANHIILYIFVPSWQTILPFRHRQTKHILQACAAPLTFF
jgi:hypothetical protein